jgi:hypothetical protein
MNNYDIENLNYCRNHFAGTEEFHPKLKNKCMNEVVNELR